MRRLSMSETAVQAHHRGPTRLCARSRRQGSKNRHRYRPEEADLPAELAHLQRSAANGEVALPEVALRSVPRLAEPAADWPWPALDADGGHGVCLWPEGLHNCLFTPLRLRSEGRSRSWLPVPPDEQRVGLFLPRKCNVNPV